MNRYLIECINDCKNEFVVAYAPSMYDDNMSKAADDPLRILRGIRFSITKRLLVSQDMWQVMKSYDYFNKMPVVSEERIREELTKCFKCNSSLALGWLSELTELRDYIFTKTSLWLKPTNEK